MQAAQEGEDLVAEHVEHFGGGHVLEAGPAHGVVRAALCIGARGDEVHGLGFEAQGFVVFAGLVAVEGAQKEQVGDLLDDFDGVGDAAGPEGVPDLIDFVAQVTGEHGGSL